METAALRIGCKVNLTLRITGVRPNGWHELDTVFLPLDEPSDTLRLALRPGGGLALHCAEPGIDPENNTLTKAYRLFAEASGFRPGVEAVLEKGIPHGAGLGGGSADAAALLGWLNARAPEPLPLPELVGLAARIGGALAGEAVMVAGYFAYEGVVLGFGLGHRRTARPVPRVAGRGGRRRGGARPAVPRGARVHAVGLCGMG